MPASSAKSIVRLVVAVLALLAGVVMNFEVASAAARRGEPEATRQIDTCSAIGCHPPGPVLCAINRCGQEFCTCGKPFPD